MNARAAEARERYAEYGPPVKGAIENVYCMVPYADAAGRTKVMLRNAAADRAVTMAFSVEQLPYFALWKNPAAVETAT